MDRYICIHTHMYQPPRENPWLEVIEIQDSAYPYHDWNVRVAAECYVPNSASRILDTEGRIMDIVSNYAKISFNFGPTLLSWMENHTPAAYRAIIEADRQSVESRSGHGNALAQVYNHIIMPLANRRDRRTQVIWGIRDFEHRFGRFPEGMWLAETAVDLETLEILSEMGIKFTILAPRQAAKSRRIGVGKWRDVSGGRIDPTRPYLCRLPSGRSIALFFYDGPISLAVAFEKLLESGENFAHRLISGFSDSRDWPQLMHIATDGESYGHHHRHGEMALAYALNYIESNNLAQLTNYGEFLEKHPPVYEAQIFENSSWSCIHGVERWRSNCGCNSGGKPSWNQEWRKPLRIALDWLRDELEVRYEFHTRDLLSDPWKARDEYIMVLLDRSEETIEKFFRNNQLGDLLPEKRSLVLRLMEMQRHAMLMYTSCGWFFDELSGIETTQVLQYAARAVQLAREFGNGALESDFLEKLSEAKSNIPEYRDGALMYDLFVRPSMIDLTKVGVHYAVSAMFEEYGDHTDIFSYEVFREDFYRSYAGTVQFAVGKIIVHSKITRTSDLVSFCVLYLGGHSLNCGARTFQTDEAYIEMKEEVSSMFETGDFAEMIRIMDAHFGTHNYSLLDLFRDEQRKILNIVTEHVVKESIDRFREMYERNHIMLGFMKEAGMSVPRPLMNVVESVLNHDLWQALQAEELDVHRIDAILSEIGKWNVTIDTVTIEFVMRHKLEGMMERMTENPGDLSLIEDIRQILRILQSLPMEVNFWKIQNYYYDLAKNGYRSILKDAGSGNKDAVEWLLQFRELGETLYFNTAEILPDDHEGTGR